MKRNRESLRRPAAAGIVLALLIAAAPAAGEDPAGEGCILESIELDERGPEAVLRIGVDGTPGAVGASIEPGVRVVLDFSGCVLAGELSELDFPTGLVSAVRFPRRAADVGTDVAVAVEIRRPFEYSVSSGRETILVELRPARGIGDGAAIAADAGAAGREPIRVLEPLPPEPPPPPPEPPSTPPEPPAPDASSLEELVERWAEAWSGRRVEDYLSFYAAGFLPPEGSRAAWEATRRLRLAEPQSIEVTVEELRIASPEPGRATVSFWQSYRSDRYRDRVYKTQTWIDEGGRFKILEETVAPVEEPGAPALAPAAALSALVEGARLSVVRAPTYDSSYRVIPYPGGDPGWARGSGTDVVVRAFRALGVDLQKLIHEDILAAGAAYGIEEPDPNIDHRRLRNLLVFLRRHGQTLPVEPTADWRPGDLVFWTVDGRRPDHVGIVGDRPGADGRPLVIHHAEGQPPREEDVLFAWPVRAHLRWRPFGSSNPAS